MSLELIKHLSLLQAKLRFYRKIVEIFYASEFIKQQALGIDLGVEGAPDETTVAKCVGDVSVKVGELGASSPHSARCRGNGRRKPMLQR
jgi:hypothetical protein